MNNTKKYIWIYWTKPQRSPSFNLGYLLMMLSSIQRARSYASDITVYTDSRGKQVLESFGFKDQINTSLDDIKINVTRSMFIYPKMFVLSQIKEPVIYLDHDFLINSDFKSGNLDCDLTVEFLETTQSKNIKHSNPDVYKRAYETLIKSNNEKLFSFINTYPQNLKSKFDYITGYNCGFISINNVEVANQWAQKAVDLYTQVDRKNFKKECNIILERSLLYYESLNNGWKIDTLQDKNQIDGENYLHAAALTKLEHLKLIPDLLQDLEQSNPIAAAKAWKNMPINSRKYIRNNKGFKRVDQKNNLDSEEAKDGLFRSLQLFFNYIFSEDSIHKNDFSFLRERICEEFKDLNFCENGKLSVLYSDILQENYFYFYSKTLSIIEDSAIDLEKLNLIFRATVLGNIFLKNAHANEVFGRSAKRSLNQTTPFENQSNQDSQKEPSLVKMAGNFAIAMKNFAKSGFLKVTEEQHAQRMEICKGCEFWKPDARAGMGKCLKCGCTGAKQWIATSVCPINKWGEISKEEVEASKEKENAKAQETQDTVSQQADGSSQKPPS